MRRSGRLWFRDTCGGVTWEHRLVSESVLLRLAGRECYALSLESHQAVYYAETQAPDALRLLYCHETHHRPSMVPGEVHVLHTIYGTTDDDVYNHREETAATYYGRVYNEAAGPFLKLPKPPYKRK